MNNHFRQYIEFGKTLAARANINWRITMDRNGHAIDESMWNFNEITNDSSIPIHWLRDFGTDKRTDEYLASIGTLKNTEKRPLSPSWCNLIKSAAVDCLLIRKTTGGYVVQSIARPLRVLATCAENREPWEIRASDVEYAFQIAMKIQPGGKLADQILGVVKGIFDTNHLSEACPLTPLLNVPRRQIWRDAPKSRTAHDAFLMALNDKKRADRLPDERAFWELMRIVFAEQPKSYLDFMRFSLIKVLVLTGLRIQEVVSIPADWQRVHTYFGPDGLPVDSQVGYSQATSIRYFAEKQQKPYENSAFLHEALQFIPVQFEEILTITLEEMARVSEPLRKTLQMQVQTGRLLPWFKDDQLVNAVELYPYLTGNPVLYKGLEEQTAELAKKYYSDFSLSIIDKLFENQRKRLNEGEFTLAFYALFRTVTASVQPLQVDGSPFPTNRKNFSWRKCYFRIKDIESFLLSKRKTKLPDLKPWHLQNKVMQPWELLALAPKRSLCDGREGGICDITRYFSVGVMDSQMLHSVLRSDDGQKSLFQIYSHNDEDRALSLTPHSLRHLQNNELFRLGVADTIITKRFNRKNVTQSYEYDHRSLLEQLEQIELPDSIEKTLGEKASMVAKLIQLGEVDGPLVSRFKEIQRESGDVDAFEFLRIEADGFHSTPYGHCLNSFTVDPCPKHLECFAGCRHFVSTGIAENRESLVMLRGRLKMALDAVNSRPKSTLGRENQIRHIQDRIEGVSKLLSVVDRSEFSIHPDLEGKHG